MRAFAKPAVAALAALAFATPALAITATATVNGNIAVHSGPDDRFAVVGYLRDGTEITVDHCTQTDSDSDVGSWIGDAGHTLWPAGAATWCRIPDVGWVARDHIEGRGLIHVTPPDFAGPGW